MYRTELQKAHIMSCTVYHIPTSCVWREVNKCVALQAERDNDGAQGKKLWTAQTPEPKLLTSCTTSSLLRLVVLALGRALHSAQSEATSSCLGEYAHVF